MKRTLSLILLLGLSFAAMAQWTEFPSVDRKKPNFVWGSITTVITTNEHTAVIMGKEGSSISSETYLEYTNPGNGLIETKKLTRAEPGVGENSMKLRSMGAIDFTLYFPPLPEGVTVFDMIEPKGVRFYGVHVFPVKYETPKEEEKVQRLAATENDLKTLINSSDFAFSGFYESIENDGYKLAVLQTSDTIYVVYVGHDKGDVGSWKYGEVKSILRSTAINGAYKALWYMRDKTKGSVLITFDAISMTVSFDGEYSEVYVKMGGSDTAINGTSIQSEQWTGTGYAIGDGYVVTNNHVAGEAKTISVKGVKGDMNTGYSAEVVATDKVNDIAILRISDSRFTGFGTIPYAVQQRMADVGEDIFVLGYPMTQALGNEIKLTNGIISSRTGYQGNISTYQMSAPVQPGNSGGPMFDNKGNVIGIVVAGVPGAENVGYSIKTSYLNILIESAGLNIKFPANNTISGLSLAEKVKRVKDFVFYIECSK